MQKFLKKSILIFLIIVLSSCSRPSWFKPSDVSETPINVNDRVRKNVEEGRGIRFGKNSGQGGTFDFASSNELWRASIEILDFVPFTNASYSGGILITEWFDGNSKQENNSRDLKITVRFLSNEIRSDALAISVHEKLCDKSQNNCKVSKIESSIESEIKLAILKRAAFLERNQFNKDAVEYRKKKGRPVLKDR